MQHHTPARGTRRALAAFGTLAVSIAGLGIAAAPAHAAQEVTDVTLAWSINDESGGGAPVAFLGCNFLSAGAAGSTGSSRAWTEADGFYQTEVGNVRIEKPTSDGGWAAPTFATKCQDANGTTVTNAAGSTTGNRVVLSAGTGSVDLAAGTAQVVWDGEFTIAYYGGMTYWTVNDPVLTVAADGAGVIDAVATGYAADMDDPSIWVPIDPTPIQLATLTGVVLTADGLTVAPDYLGVEIETGSGSPQVRTGPHWGAFPQSFVDFNLITGQSSYWYSSGGAADPKKPTNPVTVGWDLDDDGGTDPGPEPGEGDVDIEVTVPVITDPPGPGEFSWTIQGTGAVSLGTAENTAAGFQASGSLHPILVEDTREDAPAWSISGQASAFSAGSDSFGAQALGWVPSVTDNTVGAVPGAPVTPGDGGLATSRTLVSAPSGHDLGSVLVTTVLNLLAPASTPAGSYSSTLTLTALS